MNTIKKTIFLSNKTDKNTKTLAILTLEKKHNGVYCTLKAYNSTPKGDLILGIKSNEKIIKQNISFNNDTYNFIVSENLNLDSSLGCVLLDAKDNYSPIIWGSEKSDNFKSQIVNNLRTNISRLQTVSTKKVILEEPIIEEPIEEKIETKICNNDEEKIIDSVKIEELNISNEDTKDEIEETAISPINSKSALEEKTNLYNINNYQNIEENYSQISLEEELIKNESEIAVAQNYAQLFESSEEEINDVIDNEFNKDVLNINGNEHKFYEMIAEQLEELFDKYPREHHLENLIDQSKWVKINYNNDDRYYVVGIIYNNNDIKYICYGVPGEYNTEPPKELKDYSQWLPVDVTNPYENGYWVMYQDADTGENVFLN